MASEATRWGKNDRSKFGQIMSVIFTPSDGYRGHKYVKKVWNYEIMFMKSTFFAYLCPLKPPDGVKMTDTKGWLICQVVGTRTRECRHPVLYKVQPLIMQFLTHSVNSSFDLTSFRSSVQIRQSKWSGWRSESCKIFDNSSFAFSSLGWRSHNSVGKTI